MKEYIIKLIRVAAIIGISVFIGVLISPEFQAFLMARPEWVAYVPIINVAIVAFLNAVKKMLPEDGLIRKIIG